MQSKPLPQPETGPDTPHYAEVLARIRKGHPGAIEELLREAQAIARRYSQAVCGRASDSDDAMQEALLQTFRHARSINEPRAFKAWLYRTVKHACLIGRRRKAIDRGSEPLEHSEHAGPVDAAATADSQLISREERDRLRAALALLPPARREVVFLRDIEGLSTREVSRVLGISEANVKVRLHRAHQELRRTLDEQPATSSARGARTRASLRSRTP